jgi:hypothetical protein
MIYSGNNAPRTVDAQPLEGHGLMAAYFGNTTSVDLGDWRANSGTTANSYLFALEQGSGGWTIRLNLDLRMTLRRRQSMRFSRARTGVISGLLTA